MADYLEIIKRPICLELEQFADVMVASLQSSNPLLNEVIAYVKQREGKSMRPILVLLFAKLYGTVNEKTLHAAASLELLHTASLIHDDVVDESDQRRGQPSVNARYDNKIAILSGDFMLANSLMEADKADNKKIIDIISVLGKNLAEGELLQLSNISAEVISENVYFEVIRKKTAALFMACTQTGAYSVNATPEQCELARLFGEYLGICFQIKDDVFDYFPAKEIGKPTGNDLLEGKITLPAIHVLNTIDNEWSREVAQHVKEGTATADEIAQLVEFVKENGGIEYAMKRMHEYHQKAVQLLDTLPQSDVKESLQHYADYVISRTK